MSHKVSQEQFRSIKDHNVDYFQDGDFSLAQKCEFLHLAIEHGKINLIKLFMESGAIITNPQCIENLMGKHRKVDILIYLDSKNVDLSQHGHAPFVKAVGAKNIKYAQYLGKKIDEIDLQSMKISLATIIRKFNNNISEVKPILEVVLKKLSSDTVTRMLDSDQFEGSSDTRNYIMNEFLKVSLSDKKNSVRIKI